MELEERLAKSLDEAYTKIRLMEHDQFDKIVAAYKRGAHWHNEMGSLEMLEKAAYDYADYMTPVDVSSKADSE